MNHIDHRGPKGYAGSNGQGSEKRMVKLNLNSAIGFRLNDLGKDIYFHRWDELNEKIVARGGPPLERRYPLVDENGLSWFQLWEFMDIYGKHIGLGKPEFWDEFNFYIEEEDLD